MNYFRMIFDSVFHPFAFFKQVNKDKKGPTKIYWQRSIIFALIVSTLSSLSYSFSSSLSQGGTPNLFIIVNQLLFTLPATLVILFILAALFHLIARLLGSEGKLAKSFQAVCLSSAPRIISTLVPFNIYLSWVGNLLGLTLLVIALKFAHNLSFFKAAVVVILPVLVYLLLISLVRL